MRYKLSIGILVMLVSGIMLMSNVTASGWPPVWINQATLSVVDGFISQDPENSGFGATQVVVWEEWNGVDWDIWMKYSLLDGALGSWIFPPLHPATTGVNERYPAVTVTNANPITGVVEIHVVYQSWNNAGGGQWDVYHTYTTNFGVGWVAPFRLDNTANNDAKDPAIVYTEDVSNPGLLGMLVQITWAEFNPAPAGPGWYEILYDAYYYDPTLVPVRGYVGTTLIQSSATGTSEFPEIASVDELWTVGIYDYSFAIVWQEQTAAPLWNIWYIAGTTTTSPGAPVATPNPATLGQLNLPNGGDDVDPDIAATQDYQNPETYYFHVNWIFQIPLAPVYQVDTCYFAGAGPTPAAAAFVPTASAQGPAGIVLARPTIATKLINLAPTVFQTWMCWEDNSNIPPSNPDIWYRVGQYVVGAPPFVYLIPSMRVPYLPAQFSNEHNPELWNRNDAARMFPPLTHLVFDQILPVVPPVPPEVVYIDP